jgi:raffinose/stachyose/melibiose transport system permease protein
MKKVSLWGAAGKVLIVLLAIVYLIPLYIAIVNSFKPYKDIVKNPLALPTKFTFDNFSEAYRLMHIQQLYVNSVFITTISVLLLIMVCSMTAYIIAKRKNPGYRFIYIFILCGIMVPSQMVLIPSIKTLQYLHLMNSFEGLFLFYVGTYFSLGVFFYVEFIKTIPNSIEESGVMDGAGTFTIFFKLIFPLLKPCTATVLIFIGTWIWNEFLPPMYILGSNHGRTITTGIYNAVGQYTTQWNLVFASVIFAALPIIILYLFMQKLFIKGLTAGAVKG